MTKDKLKVLEVTGEPIASGGQEMFIVNVLRHMNMKVLQIDLLTPYYCDNNAYRKDVEKFGGKVICQERPFHPGSLRTDIIKPLYHYLKNNKYDVAHIHSGSITILALASLITWLCGIKKIIVHSHSTGKVKDLRYRLLKIFSYPFLRFIPDEYCACSVAAGEWKFPKSVVRKKLRVINNGVDLDLFSPNPDKRVEMRRNLGILESSLVIGNVGRFSLTKNHSFTFNVFKVLKDKIQNSKLMLVGDGELMDEAKERVKELGIEKDVIFVGRVNNVQDYVQAMDVFVFPSLWEGLGLVGVEAQGVGIPVIASTNVPQEMKLTDDVFYLPLDNIEKWVDKIIEVSSFPRKNNIDKIREQGYDINQTAEEVRKLYITD